MELKQLRDKLESIDLNQIEGIQWDQERTWSRLNGQLLSTNNNRKKGIIWYYTIAASIALFIVVGYAYMISQSSRPVENETNLNKDQLAINDIIIEGQKQIAVENCEPEETSSTISNFIKEESNIKSTPSPLLKGVFQNITTIQSIQSNNSIENEKLTLHANHDISEVKIPIENTPSSKRILSQKRVAMEGVLSSEPIKPKKKALSIRFFKRKNKSRKNSTKKIPQLSLFASK